MADDNSLVGTPESALKRIILICYQESVKIKIMQTWNVISTH